MFFRPAYYRHPEFWRGFKDMLSVAPGIAAWGAVMKALLEGRTFQSGSRLMAHRAQLARALLLAFPGEVFNAPISLAEPTTLNFSVPGLSSNT